MEKQSDRIQHILDTLNLSQATFAHGASAQRQNVTRWLKGGSPSSHHIIAIRKAFGINDEWLVNGIGDMFMPTHVDPFVRDMHLLSPRLSSKVKIAMVDMAKAISA